MAEIYYHDIGDYLSREEKLSRIRSNRSVLGMDWVKILPNEKHDWINQRDGVFDSMILLGDKDDKTNKQTVFRPCYSRGLATARDAWCYNYCMKSLVRKMHESFDFYNEQRLRYVHEKSKNPSVQPKDIVEMSETTLSWNRGLLNDCRLNRELVYKEKGIRNGIYRPYCYQHVYFDADMNDMTYQLDKIFPSVGVVNLLICMSSPGDTKDYSCLIVNSIPDLHLVATTQCFPLYWYEENKNKQKSLFDDEQDDNYIRRDGITDWILKEVRMRYGAKTITKEMIFYYVYGLLHSKDYRERFAADLKKSLPRIPIVDSVEDFMDFYRAGKRLADLHLNYEAVAPHPDVVVRGDRQVPMTVKQDPATGGYTEVPVNDGAYDYFRVVDKMRFKSKQDKSTIVYNGNITIENIPAKAYDYVVNGKSAIEWLVERYAVTIDKKSLIKNDANDWAREHHKPRYILDLLLSVINVSVQTVDIVNSLPRLAFD